MSLLDKSYIATNYRGEVFLIDDIEAYIKKWGSHFFSHYFGLEFNWKPGFSVYTQIDKFNYFVRECDYVLENLSGEKIDPKDILNEYFVKNPKVPRITNYTVGTVRSKRWHHNYVARYKRPSRFRLLKQQMICKDEMEPDIRHKSQTGYLGYYSDDRTRRERSRSWKSYRKTQYK